MKVCVSLTLAACYATSSTAVVVAGAARRESLEESADDPTHPHRVATSTLETTMFLPDRHDGETSSSNALLHPISRISEMWHRSLVSSGLLRNKKSTSTSTITRSTLAEPRAAPAQPMPVGAAPVARPVPVMPPKVPVAAPVSVPYPSRPNSVDVMDDFILQSDAPSKTPSTAPTVGNNPVAPFAPVGRTRAATKVPSESPLDPTNESTLDSDAPSRTPSKAPTRKNPTGTGPNMRPKDWRSCSSWTCEDSFSMPGHWMYGGYPCKKVCVLPDDRTYYTSRGWKCGLCPTKK